MKIAHVSDIHIRNLRYHDEYRRVFDDLYRHLDELRPDIIVNTGDTAHTKTEISPEFVEMCSQHFRSLADIAPLHVILGNHDLNLVNLTRQDAITPIVESIGSDKIFLHKTSGVVPLHGTGVNLWVFSCADDENYPTRGEWEKYPGINIGLFHGSVRTSETDSDWVLRDTDVDVSFFGGLDYVLLGDIHKHQFLNNKRTIAYAGSLIQQNFGEQPDKGFLFWDIRSKTDHDVRHVPLHGSKKFHTLRLGDDLAIPTDFAPEPGSRVRVMFPRPATLVEQKDIESRVKERFAPSTCISMSSKNIGEQRATALRFGHSVKFDNLRDLDVQDKLIKRFLKDRDLSDRVLSEISAINKKYQLEIEKDEDIVRNVFWSVQRLAWNNMFNYGAGNVIDFSKIKGIVGLFAPNSAGKSSLIDIIVQSLFDKTTSGISKNIHLVNDNKSSAEMVVDMDVSGISHVVERRIEKISYNKRGGDAKEWGKTTLSLTRYGDEEEQLTGMSRPETERSIRRRIGTYDDFVLTSFLAQDREFDIIKCKETERKKILFRFLDLDIFDKKYALARDESKEIIQRLHEFEEAGVETAIREYERRVTDDEQKIRKMQRQKAELMARAEEASERITDLSTKRVHVPSQVEHPSTIEKFKAGLVQQWEKLWPTLAEMQDQEERALATLGKIDAELAKISLAEHRASLDEAEGLSQEIGKLKTALSGSKRELRVLMDDVAILDRVPCGDKFPTCQFIVGAFKKRDMITGQVAEADEQASRLEHLENALMSKDVENGRRMVAWHARCLDEGVKLRASLKELRLRRENASLRLDALFRDALQADVRMLEFLRVKAAVEQNSELDKLIAEQTVVRDGIRKELSSLLTEEAIAIKTLGGNSAVCEKLKEEARELADVRVRCEAYEHYVEAMGKHGISYHILVEKLPLINEEINKILSSVCDFGVMLEHDEEEQTIRINLQYGDYKSRPLQLGGGAERMISSIAIRAALLGITNLPKTNMFIIDEGFGSLDAKNMENMQKMFDYLRGMFDHVLVISHIDVLKDMVDNSIAIVPDDEGYSHIEVT